jgi:D-lactate dehydrogenase
MEIAVFSMKPYDAQFLQAANKAGHKLRFYEPRLDATTAPLARGAGVVCAFVNDTLSEPVLVQLEELGVRLIAMRCAGYNNVDTAAAARLGIGIVRVPAYSPHAVAEHTVGLMLSLNRHLHRAYQRVRDGNFSLDGLLGFDLFGRTVGVIGTGRIGRVACAILRGFGCNVVAYDLFPDAALAESGVQYVSLDELLAESDIVTLHCPLTKENYHLIDDARLSLMKAGVMLINTSRGALLDTRAVIEALKSGKVGALGLDVYEEEGDLFFEDLSNRIIPDDTFSRLLTFPNVLVTGHQAFFTKEALTNIAETTLANVAEWEATGTSANAVQR